jgi:hypothetical protein
VPDATPIFAHLSDDELMDRYRRSKGPNLLTTEGETGLGAELRRRGLMPDGEDTIPGASQPALPEDSGPGATIEPGPGSAAADDRPQSN